MAHADEQVYPKYYHRPHIVRASDGRWLVRKPLPCLDDITAYLILGGPYRWRWQARLQLWRLS